nr:979_t:CDS:2 [Entrophospora candida]CAG8483761.1 3016_t:CDS:2 [Entrophospora candida]
MYRNKKYCSNKQRNYKSFKDRLNILAPLAAKEYDQLNVLEEDNHASLCNTARSPKVDKIHWTLKNTETFYKMIALYGTNYIIIAHKLGYTVTQISIKYKKEMKKDPERMFNAIFKKGEFSNIDNR